MSKRSEARAKEELVRARKALAAYKPLSEDREYKRLNDAVVDSERKVRWYRR